MTIQRTARTQAGSLGDSVTSLRFSRQKPTETQNVLDAFAEVSPRVHQEPGCEFYAAHTDGNAVVMIERWVTREDLDAHSSGEPLSRLNELTRDALVKPYDVWLLSAALVGDPIGGVAPRR